MSPIVRMPPPSRHISAWSVGEQFAHHERIAIMLANGMPHDQAERAAFEDSVTYVRAGGQ